MKYKLFYSLFLMPLLLLGLASCTQKNTVNSAETKIAVTKINQYLEQVKSETLSTDAKLESIKKAQALAKKNNIDSLILKTFNKEAAFYNTHFPEKALPVLKQFEELANNKKDSLYVAHALLNLGEHYYFYKKESNTAFNYFNKSSVHFKNCKDSSNVVYSLLLMSGILKEKSDYYDMEAVNTEALKFIYATDKNYKYNYSCVYNNLGIALKQTYDYEKSLYFYKKARQYTNADFAKIILENNIAAVYTLNNQPQKALDILLPLYQSQISTKNASTFVPISNNIGQAYLKLNDPKSLNYFLEGLNIRLSEKDNYGLIDSYAHLADYYKTKTPALAKNYALQSYQLATKMGVSDARLYALEILSTTTNGKDSNDYLNHYFKLNDSITTVKQKNKNQFAKMRYDFGIHLEQIQKLKTQQVEKDLKLANSNNQVLLLLLFGILSVGSTVIGLNYLKRKSKKAIEQEGYKTETRIAKQLHDELANDVYRTMTFAETQDLVDENNKETLLNNLDLIYKRTRNISKENSSIDTTANFDLHLKEMIADFSSKDVNVLINGIDAIPFQLLDSNKKIVIFRVIQELLINMKKHSQASFVALSFKKSPHSIQISYSDNGVGLDSNSKISKNGLQNVENRIESIKGTINFDSTLGKGFKVNISIPV